MKSSKTLLRTKVLLILVLLVQSNSLSAQQDYYPVTAGNGFGVRLWNSDSYKIHMGNSTEYKYGPVSDFSIKMNMSNTAGRGWTWGVTGLVPVAALNTLGDFQVKGDLYALGNVGVGTTNATNILTLAGDALAEPSLLIRNTSYNSTNSSGTVSMQFAFANHTGPTIEATKFSTNISGLNFYGEYGFNVKKLAMTIRPYSAGPRVGIGTSTPDATLTVKGTIHSEEVKVDLSVPAPDYVFLESYDLRTLEETKDYIEEHGHLPNIPTAAEMEENGVELGAMNMKLLEKIEELTLYVLKLNEEIQTLKAKK